MKHELTPRQRKFQYWMWGFTAVFALLVMPTVGYQRIWLNSIAVSEDETRIAYAQIDPGSRDHRLTVVCLQADGTVLFETTMDEISEGGNCSVYFQGDELCVMMYRKHETVFFSPDGSITRTELFPGGDYPEEYPSFTSKPWRKFYDGQKFNLIYESQNPWSYYYGRKERTLTMELPNGEDVVLWNMTAIWEDETK